MIDYFKGSLGTGFADPTALNQIWVRLLVMPVGLDVGSMSLTSQVPLQALKLSCVLSRENIDYWLRSPSPGRQEGLL